MDEKYLKVTEYIILGTIGILALIWLSLVWMDLNSNAIFMAHFNEYDTMQRSDFANPDDFYYRQTYLTSQMMMIALPCLFINPSFYIIIGLGVAFYIVNYLYNQETKEKKDIKRNQLRKQSEKATRSRGARDPRIPKRQDKTSIQSESKEKETIIRERVKVIYDLPERCPSCQAPLKYETIKMRGPTKAECAYCNTMFDLIEKEI